MNVSSLEAKIRAAWANIAAPPAEDLEYMEQEWGDEAACAFTGVAPMKVDLESPGFSAATPLLDLPPRASAAYLGTYLLSLLQSLQFQENVGLFDDITTRAHIINVMTNRRFWEDVVRRELSPECQQVAADVARFMAAKQDALALEPEDVQKLLALSAGAGAWPAD